MQTRRELFRRAAVPPCGLRAGLRPGYAIGDPVHPRSVKRHIVAENRADGPSTTSRPAAPPPAIDTSVAHPARVYEVSSWAGVGWKP